MASHQLQIVGLHSDAKFHAARVFARNLKAARKTVSVDLVQCTEMEREDWFLAHRGLPDTLHPLVMLNGSQVLGDHEGLVAWARRELEYTQSAPNMAVCRGLARAATRKWLEAQPAPPVYFDLQQQQAEAPSGEGEEGAAAAGGGSSSGGGGGGARSRVVIALADASCPLTAANFRALCTGEKGSSPEGVKLHFKGSPIHRATDGFVQGGDIVDGSGKHSVAATGEGGALLPDESFAVRHDRAGVVGMAHAGRPHSNGSQFYVALQPMPAMDDAYVACGRVVSGMRALRMLARTAQRNQRPTPDYVIVDCGVLAARPDGAKQQGGSAAEALRADAAE